MNQVWITLDRDDETLTIVAEVPLGGRLTRELPDLWKRVLDRARPLWPKLWNKVYAPRTTRVLPGGRAVVGEYFWQDL